VLETSYYTKQQFKAFRSLEAYNQWWQNWQQATKQWW
jgi:hypothetical protein